MMFLNQTSTRALLQGMLCLSALKKKIDFFFNFDSVPSGSERAKKGCSLLVVSIQSVECPACAAKAGLETMEMEQLQ